jgi:hypothetical protein
MFVGAGDVVSVALVEGSGGLDEEVSVRDGDGGSEADDEEDESVGEGEGLADSVGDAEDEGESDDELVAPGSAEVFDDAGSEVDEDEPEGLALELPWP